MGVVQAQAWAGVGGHTDTKHHFLQLGLAHLGHHGRFLGVGRFGVQGQEHRVVVATGCQSGLGVQHVGFAVVLAGGQAANAGNALGVVALSAFYAQRAELVQGTTVVAYGQLGLVAVAIDVGAAVADFAVG